METDRPWERWQVRHPAGGWCSFKNDDLEDRPLWDDDLEYRRKPRTITINGRELVAPERVAPAVGARYWTCVTTGADMCICAEWRGGSYDQVWLERGLVFLREEDARAMTEALLSLLKGDG